MGWWGGRARTHASLTKAGPRGLGADPAIGLFIRVIAATKQPLLSTHPIPPSRQIPLTYHPKHPRTHAPAPPSNTHPPTPSHAQTHPANPTATPVLTCACKKWAVSGQGDGSGVGAFASRVWKDVQLTTPQIVLSQSPRTFPPTSSIRELARFCSVAPPRAHSRYCDTSAQTTKSAASPTCAEQGDFVIFPRSGQSTLFGLPVQNARSNL